jgi:hypothetical protein
LSDFGDELMVHWSKIDEAKKAEDEEKKREEAERLKAAQLQQQKEREEKAKQRSFVAPSSRSLGELTSVSRAGWSINCRKMSD